MSKLRYHVFSGTYDEDLNFQNAPNARFFNCGMMLNGEFIILRQSTVSFE